MRCGYCVEGSFFSKKGRGKKLSDYLDITATESSKITSTLIVVIILCLYYLMDSSIDGSMLSSGAFSHNEWGCRGVVFSNQPMLRHITARQATRTTIAHTVFRSVSMKESVLLVTWIMMLGNKLPVRQNSHPATIAKIMV